MKTYLDIHDVPSAGSGNVDASLVGRSPSDVVRTLLGSVPSGLVYCLVEAPDREMASRAHREAHGLVAHTLLEVKSESLGLVIEAPSDPTAGLARPS